ncbi:PCBP2 protein, partial [Sterrhoptilus dennistouni]|nr:PCBP2 protein [Sterrhoptilus dennistouni]
LPTMDTGVIEGGLNVTLTIRLLMHGKVRASVPCGDGRSTEVAFASPQSGARINISEGNCPERIITLAGPTNAIFKAFAMIIDKLEEVAWLCPQPCQGGAGAAAVWGWRSCVVEQELGVLLTWCGAELCGPHLACGGTNSSTGAQVQVAGDMLPNSTERAITIAGIPQSIIECVKQICVVMLESPPKGVTIPYRPKPSSSPVIFAGGQAYTIQGQYAIPQPDVSFYLQLLVLKSTLFLPHLAKIFSGRDKAELTPFPLPSQLIGCIIGRQGAKINEIRQMSGAQIKIANPVEGSTDRQVTITGSAASISLAQYLI